MDKSTCKLVEEELDNNMPGDTKQWLSKLLEAPIMQADTPLCIMRFMHFALCILKADISKIFKANYFDCSTSRGSSVLSPSRNRSTMVWTSTGIMGERATTMGYDDIYMIEK